MGWRRSTTAVALVVAALGAVSMPAQADVGDGKLACNSGEICFSRDYYSGTKPTYQKHFWYSGDHDGYYFVNVNTGVQDTTPLRDNANALRNRDTQCSVKVIDWRSFWPDDTQTIPNTGQWVNLDSSVVNQNDRHERVNCA